MYVDIVISNVFNLNKHFYFLFFSFIFMAYSNLNFSQLLHKLDNVDIKNNIWSYEKIKKLIFSAKYGILFNQICLDDRLYSTFTNIYITHP